MRPATAPIELIPDAPTMVQRLVMLLGAMMALVARRFLLQPRLLRLSLPLWGWLSRKRQRFERMMNRPVVVRAPVARTATTVRAVRVRKIKVGLPSGRGWLVKELGWEAAAYASQLTALLDDPAMRAALAGVPGLERLLRPVCHILGVESPALPLRVRRARPKVAPVARAPRKPALPAPPRWLGPTRMPMMFFGRSRGKSG